LLSSWLRVIRLRFLLASIVAVSIGLAIAIWKEATISPSEAFLTYAGVIFLHSSVDLLNDYWDHKRGIDAATVRTRFSGGTGVLPENLLDPRSVYIAGIVFLIAGSSIGAYFVYLNGIAIAIILGFAVVSIYFYSTRIVDSGLAELFVAIKATMIVIGTFYVQVGSISAAAVYAGVIAGLLSATVLFTNSFPDYSADKSSGRRTLVVILGKQRAAFILPIMVSATYALIIAGPILGMTKIYSLFCFISLPFAIKASSRLIKDQNTLEGSLVPAMSSTVAYSRITGVILAASFLV
jgi:1,4-dihydroxy-2-naphthoate octaprenyltransferase